MAYQIRNLHSFQYIDITQTSAATLSVTDAGEETSALPAGFYIIWSDNTCFVNVGTNPSTGLTTATGLKILGGAAPAGPFLVENNMEIGGIVTATVGTATLSYQKIGE